jgi:deoxyribonuclease-4
MVKIKLGYGISLPVKYDVKMPDYSVENIKLIKKLSKKFDCVQVMFSSTQIKTSELEEINSIIKNYKLIYVHASYQINMGAELLPSQTDLYNSGIEILLNEIEWAKKINAKGIVLHMGKNVKNKSDPTIIYNNMVKFIIEIFKKLSKKNNPIQILLETPAGQGGEMCWDINEFVEFIRNFSQQYFYSQLGICLDTCHMFQAGLDFNNDNLINRVHQILEPVRDKIKLIHLNDSYHPVGSRTDRHEQIGHGYIYPIQLIRFIYPYKSVPMILETVGPYQDQIQLIKKSIENINACQIIKSNTAIF